MPKAADEIKQEIQVVIDGLVQEYSNQKNGFNLNSLTTFVFTVGAKLVEAVEDVGDATGEVKKQVVKSAVKEIYAKYNPDIPWIVEPFETMLETMMLDKALDSFVDFIVAKYNEKGVFQAAALAGSSA